MKDHLIFTIPVTGVDAFMAAEFEPSLAKCAGRLDGPAGAGRPLHPM